MMGMNLPRYHADMMSITLANVLLYLAFASLFTAFLVVLTGVGGYFRPFEDTVHLASAFAALAALSSLAFVALYVDDDVLLEWFLVGGICLLVVILAVLRRARCYCKEGAIALA